MNVADALVPRAYTDKEVIIKQGDAADGMYFIEDGTVLVVKVDGNGVEKEVSDRKKNIH
jgi:cAMP-dependent protein kinase regulator